MLKILESILDEISKEHTTDDQREAAVIHYWTLHDPLASWRRLIDELHWQDEHDCANRIYHYAEELTGMYTPVAVLPVVKQGRKHTHPQCRALIHLVECQVPTSIQYTVTNLELYSFMVV